MERRSLLKGVGATGVVGLGLGAGLVQRHRGRREGRVFWRQMAVDAGGEPGSLIVMTESIESDGSVGRDLHPDYADAYGSGPEAPESLHRELQREYGDDEPYYVVRYDAHDCNGIPGDEGGDTIEVSRAEFNRLTIDTCVRR